MKRSLECRRSTKRQARSAVRPVSDLARVHVLHLLRNVGARFSRKLATPSAPSSVKAASAPASPSSGRGQRPLALGGIDQLLGDRRRRSGRAWRSRSRDLPGARPAPRPSAPPRRRGRAPARAPPSTISPVSASARTTRCAEAAHEALRARPAGHHGDAGLGQPNLRLRSAMRISPISGQLQARRRARDPSAPRSSGTRSRASASKARWPARVQLRHISSGGRPPQAAMSPPAQKALPSPLMIATRTSAVASMRAAASASACDHGRRRAR